LPIAGWRTSIRCTVPAGPHRIDALSLFSLFSLRQNISQRHLVFRRNPAHRRSSMRKNSLEAGCSFTVFRCSRQRENSEKRLLERTGSARRFDERSAHSVTMAAVCIPCDLVKNMNLASPVGAVCAFPPREMDFAPRSHVLPSSGATDPEAPPLQPDECDPAPRPGRGIGQGSIARSYNVSPSAIFRLAAQPSAGGACAAGNSISVSASRA